MALGHGVLSISRLSLDLIWRSRSGHARLGFRSLVQWQTLVNTSSAFANAGLDARHSFPVLKVVLHGLY